MSNPGAAPAESGAHLPWLTRIAYGLGDTAQNVVWGAMGILTFFYTDYAGIDPAMVGLVMLISRCFDGFSDVIMGFLVERTNSKWGKSRPWKKTRNDLPEHTWLLEPDADSKIWQPHKK